MKNTYMKKKMHLKQHMQIHIYILKELIKATCETVCLAGSSLINGIEEKKSFPGTPPHLSIIHNKSIYTI